MNAWGNFSSADPQHRTASNRRSPQGAPSGAGRGGALGQGGRGPREGRAACTGRGRVPRCARPPARPRRSPPPRTRVTTVSPARSRRRGSSRAARPGVGEVPTSTTSGGGSRGAAAARDASQGLTLPACRLCPSSRSRRGAAAPLG